MSLEVKDYKTRRKQYELDEGTFLLRPPYMFIVDEAQKYLDEMSKVAEKVDKIDKTKKEIELTELLKEVNDPKIAKKMIEVQLKLLKLLLEETENGKLENLTTKNFRQDFFIDVVTDFFRQFGKFPNTAN